MRYDHTLRALRALAVPLLIALAACRGEPRPASGAVPANAPSAAGAAPAPGVIDSAVPIPELLRRFRRNTPPVAALADAPTSREALVARFARALAAADSATLARLALSRAEFAWLYYPESPLARPPYELSPGMMWFQIVANDRKGLGRLLRAHRAKPFRIDGHRCEPPLRQGPNVVYNRCVALVRDRGGQRAEAELFGSILERDGRFKFVSYANGL
ncbi:MAG TPA: hypothetical protein VFQ38_12010 [Longimicrobiales bacterium]|nr:hypothetical protein [Longimicrobiales bacterium]